MVQKIDKCGKDPISAIFKIVGGLTLTSRVGWPGNLVLTEEVLEKYSTLFDFLLGLRLTCLALTLNWQKLKVKQGRYSHKVNLIRHEMLYFLRNLHAYVAAQVGLRFRKP